VSRFGRSQAESDTAIAVIFVAGFLLLASLIAASVIAIVFVLL